MRPICTPYRLCACDSWNSRANTCEASVWEVVWFAHEPARTIRIFDTPTNTAAGISWLRAWIIVKPRKLCVIFGHPSLGRKLDRRRRRLRSRERRKCVGVCTRKYYRQEATDILYIYRTFALNVSFGEPPTTHQVFLSMEIVLSNVSSRRVTTEILAVVSAGNKRYAVKDTSGAARKNTRRHTGETYRWDMPGGRARATAPAVKCQNSSFLWLRALCDRLSLFVSRSVGGAEGGKDGGTVRRNTCSFYLVLVCSSRPSQIPRLC